MASSLLPRRLSAVDMECAPGYRFYTCSGGKFVGCCSVDPCGFPDACPSENRPGLSTSSNTPVVASEPRLRPFSTGSASFNNLSTSQTATVVIPTTHLPSPTTATTTATIATIFSPPPSSSPSSHPPASDCPSSSKQISPIGLIVGLTVGFTVLALMMAFVVFLLWRRRQTRGVGDENTVLPVRSARTTAFYLPQEQQQQQYNSLVMTSPIVEMPIPPAPTSSSRPWRESYADADQTDQARDGNHPRTPDTTTPAPTVWRHDRVAAPSPAGACQGAQPTSRSASPADSIFDTPQRRTTAELDASCAVFREDPAAFHGLSAPPRSRDGSRPGSNSNPGG